MALILFEIELVPVYVVYLFYGVPGLIGGGLALVRWWLGVIWLVGPVLFFLFLYWAVQYDHVMTFYDLIVRQEGISYIIHSAVVPVLTVALNLIGIAVGLLRQQKRDLKYNHANTESNGRI